jgi:hypothetical protein
LDDLFDDLGTVLLQGFPGISTCWVGLLILAYITRTDYRCKKRKEQISHFHVAHPVIVECERTARKTPIMTNGRR